jgi:hypothetical protein
VAKIEPAKLVPGAHLFAIVSRRSVGVDTSEPPA